MGKLSSLTLGIITAAVLTLSIIARILESSRKS